MNCVSQMAGAGDYIYELPEKVAAGCRLLGEEKSSPPLTQKQFAMYCDISLHSLKRCLRSDSHRMSSKLQTKLADGLGFSVDDPVWIDPNFRNKIGEHPDRRDTAAHFEKMLRRTRMSGVVLRLRPSRPRLSRSNLASFELASRQGDSTSGITASFEAFFWPGVDGPIVYGFSRVRLSLEFGADSDSQAVKQLGDPDPVIIRDARLVCSGLKYYPQWFLQIDQGALEGPYLTHEDPLFVLKDMTLDQEFVARLSVQLRDGDVFIESNGKPGGNRTKEMVLNRLRAMHYCPDEPAADGWLHLGEQKLKVVTGT